MLGAVYEEMSAMYVVMFVLDDVNRLDAVLAAYRAVGVGSVTIAETTGAYRRLAHSGRVPTRYTLGGLAVGGEKGNCTLWAIVADEQTAHRCLAATEDVVGDLDGPATGVFAAWPVTFTKGVLSQAVSTDAKEG
jgi:hypothetical protein